MVPMAASCGAMMVYRKRQGIDVNKVYKEIPVE